MRKGQKVRILANNQIGTIAERKLVCIHGKRMVLYLVKTKDGRLCWHQPESLGSTHEIVNVSFDNESTGQKLRVKVDWDHAGGIQMTMEDLSDIGLEKQKGVHVFLCCRLLEMFAKERTKV